jgi:uncharacterized SAM-binding protein YcdF (DUF218 family)
MEFLVSPFFISLLLAWISLGILWRNTGFYWVKLCLLISSLLLLLCSTGWLPEVMTHWLESQYSIIKQVNPEVKWVVVLGGGEAMVTDIPANDALFGASIKRMVEGVRLYRELPQSRLVLSGGGAVGIPSEAEQLAQLASWFAIPQHDIVLETHSGNTEDQAIALAKIIGDKPFYLVTSAIHMPRAMYLCERLGLHPIAAPTDFTLFWQTGNWAKVVIPNTYNAYYFTIAMHEILGRIWAYQPSAKSKGTV